MKHIQTFESFLDKVNEAARVGSASWSAVLKDLRRMGWDVNKDSAEKQYDDDRTAVLTYENGEVVVTVIDDKGKEISSDSFDADGLSADELDGEVWNYTGNEDEDWL